MLCKKILICSLFVFSFIFLAVVPSFAQAALVVDARLEDDIVFHSASFVGGFSINTDARVEVLNLPSSSVEGPDTFISTGQFTTFGGRTISYHVNEGSNVIDYTFSMLADEELYFSGMIYSATADGSYFGDASSVKISCNLDSLTLYQSVMELRWDSSSPYFNEMDDTGYNYTMQLREHSVAYIGVKDFWLNNNDPYNHISNVAFMAVCSEPCDVTISVTYFNDYEPHISDTPYVGEEHEAAFYQLFANYNRIRQPIYSPNVYITENGIYNIDRSVVEVDVPQYTADRFDFGWLVNIGDTFLGFEFAPGFSVGTILIVCVGLGLILWILKIFMGG